MNEKQALILTIRVWTWLRDNPRAEKHHWYGWMPYPFYKGKCIKSGCFLCHIYRRLLGHMGCLACPLSLNSTSCELPNHPYTTWIEEEDLLCKQEAADAIVLLCEQALEGMEE